jgi:hypothetical protein
VRRFRRATVDELSALSLSSQLLAWLSLPYLSGWSLGLAVAAWLAVAILVWWV